ncbi:hypothetical protein [Faecalibacter bovis]|uniref:Uncharacterized protein n=1 Tax=Faecalibacter bovis TaxID=2898187 RepID=A0ABX7XDC5_9FLAO|nr:hypothetical protein [Faecalibacter bovis]QTV05926.1 hypothetical protein J9309_00830 [Faecalibacter bovis]
MRHIIFLLLPVLVFSGIGKGKTYFTTNLCWHTGKTAMEENPTCMQGNANYYHWAFGFVGLGFKGSYVTGNALTDNTFEVRLTNTAKQPIVWKFDTKDLQLNIEDVHVTAVYEAGMQNSTTTSIDLTFAPYSTKTIVYQLSGDLNTDQNAIKGIWKKFFFTYHDSQAIIAQ